MFMSVSKVDVNVLFVLFYCLAPTTTAWNETALGATSVLRSGRFPRQADRDNSKSTDLNIIDEQGIICCLMRDELYFLGHTKHSVGSFLIFLGTSKEIFFK